jgi:hypothetical protein
VVSITSGESESGAGFRTELGGLDGSDVVGEIIFDIRVSERVKGDIAGLGTGVITIT